MKSNYHTHTNRCFHAYGTDEEYVMHAIEGGYQTLGFSDHTPWPFPKHYVSRMRMGIDMLQNYLTSLQELKERYSSQIEIKIGLECEYFPEYIHWLRDVYHSEGLDYLLLGHHFPYQERSGIYFGDIYTQKELHLYLKTAIAAMETGLYHCFAHPDLFVRSYPRIDHEVLTVFRQLCIAARDCNVVMERNVTVPYYSELWEIASEEKVKVIVGMDAHSPEVLHNTNSYDAAVAEMKLLRCRLVTAL